MSPLLNNKMQNSPFLASLFGQQMQNQQQMVNKEKEMMEQAQTYFMKDPVKNLLTGGMTREENKKRSGTEEEDEG